MTKNAHESKDKKALQNYDAALKANSWLTVPEINTRVEKIVGQPITWKAKRAKLIQIIDVVNVALAPFVACKQGCSHCCHIAVTITQTEAEAIGKALNLLPVVLPPPQEHSLSDHHNKYRDVACTFLKNDECSIYAMRPVACRAHHSLNDDNVQCRLSTPSESSSVTSFNLRDPEFAIAQIAFQMGKSVGDIREYFPNVLKDETYES